MRILVSIVLIAGCHHVYAEAAMSRAVGADFDALPAGASRRLGSLELRHANLVASVAYSPDGKWVAAGSIDGAVVIWDVATRKPFRILPGETFFVSNPVAFSPDGKLLATVNEADKAICLWDTSDWTNIAQMAGHEVVVGALAFSPDGKSLASSSGQYLAGDGERDYTVRIWDVVERKQKHRLSGHIAGVMGIAWSPDGKVIASGSWDCTSQLWDAETGKLLRKLQTDPDDTTGTQIISAVAFSKDATRIYTVGFSHLVRHWDVASGAEIRELRREEGWISDVALHPKGHILATCDSSIMLWDTRTSKRLLRMPGYAAFDSIAYSPDGLTLVSGSRDQTIRFWNTETGEERFPRKGHQAGVVSVCFSPDGKTLLTGGKDGKSILWNVKTGAQEREMRSESAVRNVHWSTAGPSTSSFDKTVRFWNAATGEESQRISYRNSHARVACNSDGSKWLIPQNNGDIVLTDGSGTQQLVVQKDRSPEKANGAVNGETVFQPNLNVAVFADDGSRAAVFDTLGNLYAWDLQANALHPVSQSTTQGKSLNHVVFSPDGRLLSAALTDGSVRVWEWVSGIEIFRREGDANYTATCAFSPDSRTLAISGRKNGEILLADVLASKEWCRFPGHRWELGHAYINALAFSPDGNTLASGSDDGTALLWTVPAKPPMADKNTEDAHLLKLWEALAGDAPAAHRAISELIDAGPPALDFIGRQSVQAKPDAEISELLKALDDDEYDVRERASAALIKKGSLAREGLRLLLENKQTSVEARVRASRILDNLPPTITDANVLRQLRTIHIFENIATESAKAFLQELSKGDSTSIVTQHSKNALLRLQRK